MRARKNERTYEILATLGKGEMTAAKLSEKLGATIQSTSAILLRLAKRGYVDRERVKDGVVTVDAQEGVTRPRYVFLYELTSKGAERMNWIGGRL